MNTPELDTPDKTLDTKTNTTVFAKYKNIQLTYKWNLTDFKKFKFQKIIKKLTAKITPIKIMLSFLPNLSMISPKITTPTILPIIPMLATHCLSVSVIGPDSNGLSLENNRMVFGEVHPITMPSKNSPKSTVM